MEWCGSDDQLLHPHTLKNGGPGVPGNCGKTMENAYGYNRMRSDERLLHPHTLKNGRPGSLGNFGKTTENYGNHICNHAHKFADILQLRPSGT